MRVLLAHMFHQDAGYPIELHPDTEEEAGILMNILKSQTVTIDYERMEVVLKR